jgi:AcrR family transcriptional regulator
MKSILSNDPSIELPRSGVSSTIEKLAIHPSGETTSRQARRRQQTRARLIRAAAALFARQGADNTRINEITDEADVGFGSFYNHFDSKEAIVEAVLSETLAAQGAALASVTAEIEDPAEVVAAAHRYFVNLARSDPEWGRLLIRLDTSQKTVLQALAPFAQRDLERGVRAGRFQVPNVRVALYGSGGALLMVMRDVLDGQAPKQADCCHAEGVLRMLGLSAKEAAEVARRPMPRIPSPAF